MTELTRDQIEERRANEIEQKLDNVLFLARQIGYHIPDAHADRIIGLLVRIEGQVRVQKAHNTEAT